MHSVQFRCANNGYTTFSMPLSTYALPLTSVAGYNTASLELWQLKTGSVTEIPYQASGAVSSLQFKDSLLLAGSSSSEVWSYDLNASAPLHRFPLNRSSGSPTYLRLRPRNPETFGVVSGKEIGVMDARAARGVSFRTNADAENRLADGTSLDWCGQDSGYLVAGHRDGKITIWDVRKVNQIFSLRIVPGVDFHSNLFVRTAPTPSGRYALYGGFGSPNISVLDCGSTAAPFPAPSKIYGHSAPVSCASLVERSIATGSMDYSVRLWKASTRSDLAPPSSMLHGLSR